MPALSSSFTKTLPFNIFTQQHVNKKQPWKKWWRTPVLANLSPADLPFGNVHDVKKNSWTALAAPCPISRQDLGIEPGFWAQITSPLVRFRQSLWTELSKFNGTIKAMHRKQFDLAASQILGPYLSWIFALGWHSFQFHTESCHISGQTVFILVALYCQHWWLLLSQVLDGSLYQPYLEISTIEPGSFACISWALLITYRSFL